MSKNKKPSFNNRFADDTADKIEISPDITVADNFDEVIQTEVTTGQQPSSHEEIVAETLRVENDSLRLELEDLRQKTLRTIADSQNLAKQHELELAQIKKSTKKQVLRDFVGFLNTLNLAFTFAPNSQEEAVNKFIGTLKNSFNHLKTEIAKDNIEMIIPQPGEVFNPETMVALNEHAEEGDPTVKNVASIGIKVDNQVIQAASVMI